MSQLQMQKLNEERKHEKAMAEIDIQKDLSNINIVVQSINNQKKILRLVTLQMENMSLSMENGRLDMEQFIRLKSQYSQAYMTYLTLIKSYFICIYKYRTLALFDIEKNTTLYEYDE